MVLVYRVPREPSSPRIAIWRRLRSLGVAQLGDGVVALPQDARTREQLEWVADRVVESGGTALLLSAHALARKDERTIAHAMSQARAREYRGLIARAVEAEQAQAAPAELARTVARLRKELRTIRRRDHFPPIERDEAVAAIDRLAEPATTPHESVEWSRT